MKACRIFYILILFTHFLDADELPQITQEYYDELDKEQKELELSTLFKKEQLLFLSKVKMKIIQINLEEIKKLDIKGMKLLDFIALYGYPEESYVPHNSRPMRGGQCIWKYKNKFYLQLQLSNNEVRIRNFELRE